MASKDRDTSRKQRRRRIRAKIGGSAACPRLSIYRSARHIYAQLINDDSGQTLASASSRRSTKDQGNIKIAHQVGQELAQQAAKLGIGRAVFDRGGYKYNG